MPHFQNAIDSFDSRPDLMNPTKKLSKGMEKAIAAAKAEIINMAKVFTRGYQGVYVTRAIHDRVNTRLYR